MDIDCRLLKSRAAMTEQWGLLTTHVCKILSCGVVTHIKAKV